MYEKILVTTDGSVLSSKAIQAAITLAKMCEAQLFVLQVVPRYPLSYFEGGMAMSANEIANTEGKWMELAQTALAAIKSDAIGAGVKARTITHKSDQIGESIVALAAKHRCDLVVMASHGRKGLKRLLLGSETQYVLAHASVPVLVLR